MTPMGADVSVAAEVDRYQRQLAEAETALAAQQTHDDPGLERAVETAKAAAATMRQRLDQRVGMALVGRVSSGKSILIGTLLGNPNLLPAGDLATTGNVTVLRLVQGERRSSTTALANPVVDFLDRKELGTLAEHLRDALIVAAGPERMEAAAQDALRAKELIADEFAEIDAWLRANWPGRGVGGVEQEPALTTVIRQVLALRDAVRSGGMLIGSAPLGLKTSPGTLLRLSPTVALPHTFPPYAGMPLDRAALQQDERSQRPLFPLFRHVTYEVSVPPEVWPLDGFSGEKQVVLLDFPGIGGRTAPVRDEFLSGKELAEVHTVAVCTSANDMAGNEIHQIHQLLRRHGRSAEELSRTLFLIATKFDSIGVPWGEDATKPFASLGNVKQLDSDRIDFVPGRHDQVALASSFQGILVSHLAKPNDMDVSADYQNFARSGSMPSEWRRFAEGLGPDDAEWRSLLEAVIEDGGMRRLRTRLAHHAVERGNEVKLERAKGDFHELLTALKAVERAERQFGWRESEDAARKVNTFLRELHNAASSMSARANELAHLAEIADELADRAVCGVYRWATWDVVLDRVVEYVVPQSTGSPDGDGDPDADRTDVLQEQFDDLVFEELCREAAYRLHSHAVAWREATEEKIAPLRALPAAARAGGLGPAVPPRQRRHAAHRRPETRHPPRQPGSPVPGRTDHRGPNTVAIHVLDGIGAGIVGALFPVMIADLTRGTGRYNLVLGAATTMWGIGAALSTTLAGAVIVLGGYDLAFLTLAGIALLALGLFAFAVPETSPTEAVVSP